MRLLVSITLVTRILDKSIGLYLIRGNQAGHHHRIVCTDREQKQT